MTTMDDWRPALSATDRYTTIRSMLVTSNSLTSIKLISRTDKRRYQMAQ